jgi:CDP-paratose 2-epimerase
MSVAIVTGSGGLVGSTMVKYLGAKGVAVVGIDNDRRRHFFGEEASTGWQVKNLLDTVPGYTHEAVDIRDAQAVDRIFQRYGRNIEFILHAAAQPSHDWAASDPEEDFSINAQGTLILLEAYRRHAPEAVFIFTSTNKVYGDKVNESAAVELETRYELDPREPWAEHGVDENMSLDQNLHSLFGVSKAAADLMVQEYGRYFGLKTGVFRGGCLTGSGQSSARLHGFLGYLVRSALAGEPYTIFGYKGKQVRDNIHARDLVAAFWHFAQNPRPGEVYNIGGGRFANVSVLEAVDKCQKLTGREMRITVSDQARRGDHRWWISDVRKFMAHYPEWSYTYDLDAILAEIYEGMRERYR